MAVIFVEKKKNQRKLILVFLVIIVLIGIILWQGYFNASGGKEPLSWGRKPREDVKINFDVLESAFLKNLQSFPQIVLPETGVLPWEEWEEIDEGDTEEPGRNNPFIPF